jgi:hypothetical protein
VIGAIAVPARGDRQLITPPDAEPDRSKADRRRAKAIDRARTGGTRPADAD